MYAGASGERLLAFFLGLALTEDAFYKTSAENFGMRLHQVYTFMITLCRWQIEKETSFVLFRFVLSIVPATPAI